MSHAYSWLIASRKPPSASPKKRAPRIFLRCPRVSIPSCDLEKRSCADTFRHGFGPVGGHLHAHSLPLFGLSFKLLHALAPRGFRETASLGQLEYAIRCGAHDSPGCSCVRRRLRSSESRPSMGFVQRVPFFVSAWH